MLLLIDNYDSFTYNLAHLFAELGVEVVVRRNDAITVEEAERLAPSHLVISPGPGRPADAGASEEIIRRLGTATPTLGVCLGHQAIVEAFGGEVGYALPDELTLDTCIAIRTIVLRDGIAHLQAGAGIVADSDPASEHEECLRKLAAVEAAIDLAEAEQR